MCYVRLLYLYAVNFGTWGRFVVRLKPRKRTPLLADGISCIFFFSFLSIVLRSRDEELVGSLLYMQSDIDGLEFRATFSWLRGTVRGKG